MVDESGVSGGNSYSLSSSNSEREGEMGSRSMGMGKGNRAEYYFPAGMTHQASSSKLNVVSWDPLNS